ncbi:synaptotagmin-4-like isoform X1 [Oncorhynchus masou masou]|uniref:synaptotagmin-4-like isoform X1 n=2 Tax=Oncorhynchus masou masou TaxID=90313 RepID=UPI0031838821
MTQYALGVHLQILLAVGLGVFCFCLVLGCLLCWQRGKYHPPEDKEAALSPSPAMCERVTVTLTPSSGTLPIKQQYEELDGDVLDLPSHNSSSSTSENDLTTMPFQPRPRSSSSELRSSPRSCFPMRRLSTPVVSSSSHYKPSGHGRTSLPSIPKLGLVSKTRRALERRCSVNGDNFLYSEQSRLTSPRSAMHPPGPQGELSQPQYGSSSSSLSIPTKPAPLLHFSLLFSPARGTLTTNIMGLSGAARRRSGVFVRASLPPLCPSPQQGASRRPSLSPEIRCQSLVLQVGSVEELRACTLRLAVFSRDFSGLRETALGELEMPCGEMDWEPDTTVTYTRELTPTRSRLKRPLPSQSMSSQETLGRRKSSLCAAPRALGQLFILLQYQTLAHRIKVMVRKAENLAKLSRMPGAADHYVVINLRQDGKVISTKETKGAGGHNAVWNAPFLFDLPVGDITQLPLALEFIIMQARLYTKSSMLGRVLIGCEAPEAGQGHWRDMCSQGQVETAYWHPIAPEVV